MWMKCCWQGGREGGRGVAAGAEEKAAASRHKTHTSPAAGKAGFLLYVRMPATLYYSTSRISFLSARALSTAWRVAAVNILAELALTGSDIKTRRSRVAKTPRL